MNPLRTVFSFTYLIQIRHNKFDNSKLSVTYLEGMIIILPEPPCRQKDSSTGITTLVT